MNAAIFRMMCRFEGGKPSLYFRDHIAGRIKVMTAKNEWIATVIPGEILGVDSDGAFQVVRAVLPQKELTKYSTALRALTGGRADYTDSFAYYQEVPAESEKTIVEERKKQYAAEHNGH